MREAGLLAARAGQHHQRGRAIEAEALYRQALTLCPGHAESLHGLGCLAHEAAQPALAIGLLGQAVAAAPEIAAYMLSLGLALLDRGHLEEARAALHVAVLRDERDPRAHRGLAQALLRIGRLEQAEASLRRAAALDPSSAAAQMSLGAVLHARGEPAAAIAAYRAAARLTPHDPLAWHALAAACGAIGALEEAEAAFRRVAALLPEDAAAQANLGNAWFGLNRLEEAETQLNRALGLAADNPATLSALGLVLMGLGQVARAETVLARAHGLAPEDAAIAVNHGTALMATAHLDKAEATFRAVLSGDPGHAQARFNLATALLARGARSEGWEAFEARLRLFGPAQSGLPQWDGAPIEAGAVLVRAEQGLGDSVQFLRWVTAASVRAPLRLELPPAMLRLVQQGAGFDPRRVQVAPAGEPLPTRNPMPSLMQGPPMPASMAWRCVAQASLLSLPALLGDATVPQITLRADQAGAARWRALLPAGLRVGLAWAGSPTYRFDRARSIGIEQLAPLAGIAGVVMVSLQQGTAASQPPPPGMHLIMNGAMADLADTASLIAALDLVISVDTAVAHLAGALGVPVWLLDRFGGDWRWQQGFAHGRDWYPTLRRFAQGPPIAGVPAWRDTIEAVAAALRSRVQPP